MALEVSLIAKVSYWEIFYLLQWLPN